MDAENTAREKTTSRFFVSKNGYLTQISLYDEVANKDVPRKTRQQRLCLTEAYEIMTVIWKMRSQDIKRSEVASKLPETPRYKINLTFRALVAVGALGMFSKGQYRVISGEPTDWENRLTQLKEYDL